MRPHACRERLRGNDLYRAGKLEAALGCSLSIHSADPTDIHALDNLTLTYLKLGMNERAVRAAEQVRQVSAVCLQQWGMRRHEGSTAEQHVKAQHQQGARGSCSASCSSL